MPISDNTAMPITQTNSNKEGALNKLREFGIDYDITEHRAVYTIEEMDELGINAKGNVAKNLFLRDAKGKRHFLIVLSGHKTANLSRLSELLTSSKLSFASEERLMKYLGLTKGSVTPLGVMNDTENSVEVILDSSLADYPSIGVHPNDNTATVWISYSSLKDYITRCGNKLTIMTL